MKFRGWNINSILDNEEGKQICKLEEIVPKQIVWKETIQIKEGFKREKEKGWEKRIRLLMNYGIISSGPTYTYGQKSSKFNEKYKPT